MVKVMGSRLANPVVDGQSQRVIDSGNGIVGVKVNIQDQANARAMMRRVGSNEKARDVRSWKAPVSLDDGRCGAMDWIRHG